MRTVSPKAMNGVFGAPCSSASTVRRSVKHDDPLAVSSLVETDWALATGASLTALTVIETVAVGPRRMAVIGVGLNVLPLSLRDLSTGYACLHERDAAISAPRALHMVALPLVQALLRFERDGLAPFAAAFAERDLLRGHAVVTSLPQLPGGVADGIDARGALRLLTPDTPGGVELLTGG